MRRDLHNLAPQGIGCFRLHNFGILSSIPSISHLTKLPMILIQEMGVSGNYLPDFAGKEHPFELTMGKAK